MSVVDEHIREWLKYRSSFIIHPKDVEIEFLTPPDGLERGELNMLVKLNLPPLPTLDLSELLADVMKSISPVTPATVAECICKKCNAKNEFAEPNQEDGSYICFDCR